MAVIVTKNGIISSSAGIEFQAGASSSLYITTSSIGIGTNFPSSSLDIAAGYILLPTETEPITPDAGKGALYVSSSNNHIYFKDSNGNTYDLTLTGSGTGSGNDELVKVSSNDTTAGYLGVKLVAGDNIILNEIGDGGNETLAITASLGGRYDYGTSSIDPTSPTPTGGDKYYNTVIQKEMTYDSARAKWLSVESSTFSFGKTANLAPGSYFRSIDGITFSSTSGFTSFISGTVTAIGYTRDDTDAAVFQVTADGTEVAFLSSSATVGADDTVDGDFGPNQVLGVLNKTGGNTVSNAHGWVKVRWRI